MHESRYDNIHGDEDGIEITDKLRLDATVDLLEGDNLHSMIEDCFEAEDIRNLMIKAWHTVNTHSGSRRFVEDSRIITVALAAMLDEILDCDKAQRLINERAAEIAENESGVW
jgi:hypothetical protein